MSRLVPLIGLAYKGIGYYSTDSQYNTSGKRREYRKSISEAASTVSMLEG